jgi:ethanolamine kinase
MKAINKKPGMTEEQIDADSVLLRAYGNGTHLLIDRDRSFYSLSLSTPTNKLIGECTSHSLLASHSLAPPLLARFKNGLLYRFISGRVCSPEDLRRPAIYRGVAERIAEWHAELPTDTVLTPQDKKYASNDLFTLNLPSPNVWTVLARWTEALPIATTEQKEQKALLQSELTWLVGHLGTSLGHDARPLVYGHCDLLSANVIITSPLNSSAHLPIISAGSPTSSLASSPTTTSAAIGSLGASGREEKVTVSFIDYEYATPCPAAFDLANHFAEWGGFECDMLALPSRSQRRAFLAAYLGTYNKLTERETGEKDLDTIMAQVDLFRGVPGFYWGIWAVIQAEISTIEFDYGNYATLRLSEYWAWKATITGEKLEEESTREKRWAEEV